MPPTADDGLPNAPASTNSSSTTDPTNDPTNDPTIDQATSQPPAQATSQATSQATTQVTTQIAAPAEDQPTRQRRAYTVTAARLLTYLLLGAVNALLALVLFVLALTSGQQQFWLAAIALAMFLASAAFALVCARYLFSASPPSPQPQTDAQPQHSPAG